jgi:hypothetical protein
MMLEQVSIMEPESLSVLEGLERMAASGEHDPKLLCKP